MNKINHSPTPQEAAFTHPPASDFCGVRIGDNGRLIPTAYNVVQTFETGKTPTMFYYISTNGCDQNPGTYEQPFATLVKAITFAKPGTAIRLLPGNYRELGIGDVFYNVNGTEAEPIWVGGVPGMERPVIREICFPSASYLVIHDLEVHGVSDVLHHGIHVSDDGIHESAHHVVIRGNYIHGITNSSFKVAGLYHGWYFDNELGDGNFMRGSGDMDHVGGHFINAAYNYIWTGAGTGISFKGGSANCNIYGNLIVNAAESAITMGQTSGANFYRPPLERGTTVEAYNIRTFSNIIIGGNTAASFSSSRDNYFVNNTVVLPTYFLFRILNQQPEGNPNDLAYGGGARNGVVANNIFLYDRQTAEPICIGPKTHPETFVIENNLFMNIDKALNESGGESVADYKLPTLPLMDAKTTFVKDPLFANMQNINFVSEVCASKPGYQFDRDPQLKAEREARIAKITPEDLHLQPNSPAIAAGTEEAKAARETLAALTAPNGGPEVRPVNFATHDFYGRPFKSPRSLGAIEFAK